MAIEIKEYVGHKPKHIKETTPTEKPNKKGAVKKDSTKK